MTTATEEMLIEFAKASIEMKKYEKIKKTLSAKLLEQWVDTTVIWWYKILRTQKTSIWLKEDVDVDVVKLEFPQATVVTLDLKALAQIPEAHQYLETKESPYYKVSVE